MKKKSFVALIIVFLVACSKEKIVELPLTMHNGYGPFKGISSAGISPDSDNPNNPWYKTFLKISHLPDSLTEVQSGSINANIYQNVYQNYLAENLTKEWYDDLQKSWNWIPDTTILSKSPVKIKIAFAYGKDVEGFTKFVLDTNGNLDLSDDPLFVPIDMDSIKSIADKDSLIQVLVQEHGVKVSIETFIDNKIVPVDIPILVTHAASMNMFFSNFARYATTSYKGRQIAVNSNDFCDISFDRPIIGFTPDNSASKIEPDQTYAKGEYIEMEGEILKIIGVNTNKNVLVLERADAPKTELFSTQVGYAAFPFTGEEFTARTPFTSENLRGKYILLDFWATWCAPCIQEFPALRELYAKTSRAHFEIVGIVGDSEPETLAQTIEKHGIAWTQILSDDICDIYSVNGYPTTFLINPEGVIVAKNLRGAELEERVLSLIGE